MPSLINTITTLTTLFIHIPAPDAIHPITRQAQASDPRVNSWLSGQLWAWKGGDAVTITTGGFYGAPDHRVYFVVREGTKVTIEEGESITEVMKARGYHVQVDHSFNE